MKNIIDNYLEVRTHSEILCSPLTVEDYVPQVEYFASPPKWNIAHTSWFFEELILKQFYPDYKVFNDKFSFLFNSYYNNVGDRTLRHQRGIITRPGVREVYDYRAHVDKHMSEILGMDISPRVLELTILGLNHEQQHQELFITDLKYIFSLNPMIPVYDKHFNLVRDHNTDSGWLKIAGGISKIGHNSDEFCYDNELGLHEVLLNDFEISKSLVTNEEFIEFINDGGYSNFGHWLDEAWAWVNEKKISHPLYWKKIDGVWHYYTLAGLKPVDPEAILSHISFYEASAFAEWKGQRLPTEFEWEAASDRFDWGKRWEYTNSAYLPYPGFKIAEGAVGEYNGKFMINQMVLRGASVATSKGHSRKTYRNFFSPYLQWQYSGIRLVK